MSPTVFNIVVDRDDGVITGSDPILVQSMLDIYTNAFLRVELTMNVTKTESMIIVGRKYRERKSRCYVQRISNNENSL